MYILKRLAVAKPAAVFTMLLSLNAMAAQPPLQLVGNTPLPAVTGGDFDHFAVDVKKDRLYVPSEAYESIEVFKLKTGEHLKSATGLVKSPHMMKFMPDSNELFVADALNGYCDVLDATDLHLIKRITLKPGADFGVYDKKTRTIYLGNGGKGAKSTFSTISMISVDKKEVVGEIRVEAATLKGMVIDQKTNRLFVNMRDKNQIGVIDLATKSFINAWTFPGLNSNAAMGLDKKNHRLFVGSRNPGVMYVLDSNSGKLVTTFNTVNVSDDMTFDSEHHRLIVSGADGVEVFAQDNPDSYRLVQHVDTLGGKTSVYVKPLKQFYVVHTKSDKVPQAGLQVFKVNE
jgi:DNA-binding beta-propeller fold protein YncE